MAAKRDEKDVITNAAVEQMTAGSRSVEEGLDQMADLARRQAEQARSLLGSGTRLYGDLGEISQGDVNSLIETGARLAKGAQDMGWEMVHYTQQSLQLGMKTANEMMTCRTVEDMLKVHRNYVRQSVDSLLQESVKLLELSTGTATSMASPIQQRVELRQ
ncbi:MAG: phasin family protein [Magnetospirillum sp.]|nr:phasin family protein [Magnetospirillum sp.]